MRPEVHCSIIYNSQDMETIYMCIDECGYIYELEYYSSIKINEILAFVTTWLDLEGIMLMKLIRQRSTNAV